MTPDPKWLEILKASGWQTTAIAAACGLFLLLAHLGWLPPLEPWMTLLAAFGALLCGYLALASWGSALYRVLPLHKWLLHWVAIRRAKRGLVGYIPHMTPKEREVIAYLLAKNQKTFTAEADGGYAATLLSRGIVTVIVRPGQHVDTEHVPMTIPDPLWDVLMKHREQFPYKPRRGEPEVHPWRVNYLERI